MVVIFNPNDPFGRKTPQYLPDGSVEWNPGQAKLMFHESQPVSTGFGPSLVAHRGSLFCAWVEQTSATFDDHQQAIQRMYAVYWATWQPGMDYFSSPKSLSIYGEMEVPWGYNIMQPTLVVVGDQLQLIVVLNNRTDIPEQNQGVPPSWYPHFYTWDDAGSQWLETTAYLPQGIYVCSEIAAASLNTGNGNLMYIAYQDANRDIQWDCWNQQSNIWSGSKKLGESTWGAMSMHVRRKQRVTADTPGELHLIFSSDNPNRDLLDSVFNPSTSTWSRYGGLGEASDYGVATVGDSVNAYAIFQSNNNAQDLICDQFHEGSWQRSGGSIGHASSSNPAVAVLGGKLYLCFNAVGGQSELYWDSCQISAIMPM